MRDDGGDRVDAIFDDLYARYAEPLVRWARRRLDAESDAEDVAQETFLAAFLSLQSYRGEGPIESWIFGVARNVLRQRSRRHAATKRSATVVGDDVDAGNDGSVWSNRFEEDVFLDQFESIARSRLGDDEWKLLVDRHVEEQSIQELSTERTTSAEAVKSRLYRARKRLRDPYLRACEPDA